MVWFFIITTLVLAVYVIKNIIDQRNRDQLQRGSIDALVAAIGTSNNQDKLIRNYFKNLERNLSMLDYETMLKNACVAANIIPEFDDEGRVDTETLDRLVVAFVKYATDMAESA